jgi:hypothetical protein
MPYGTLSIAIAFLPLALYAIEKSFECARFSSLILLPVSLVISFFSGHFQISLYLAAYVLAFLYFKLLSTNNRKVALQVLGFYFLGILLSLIQIIPSLELYMHSLRSGLFSNTGGIPFHYLITSIAPDFYGNPVTRNDWLGNYAEWASFIGIVSLFLSCISLLRKKEKGNIIFFLLTGIAAILLAIDTPLQALLAHLRLPVFSTSIPSRIIVLFSFSFAVLASYGIDTLKNLLDTQKLKKILLICAAFACFILFIWSLLFVFNFLPKEKAMIAARNLIIPTVFLFLATGLIAIKSKLKGKIFTNIVLYSLIILSIIDSLRFAQKWIPFDPKQLVFPDVPAITAMQKKVGQGRVYGKFGSYIDTYYRLPSIEGYDPLYIERYGQFLASARTGSFQPAIKSLAVLDKNAKYAGRVLDLLGVTVLFHVIGDTGKDWAFPVWKKDNSGKYLYSVIYQDDKFQLYNNSNALPRTKLFYDYEVLKQDKDIIKRFYSDNFDFKNKLILEEDPGLKIKNGGKGGKATIVSYTPNKIIIDVESKQAGLLFLSDNYYPKWKARINGKEEKVLRADYTLRAVVVPGGQSKVEFYYSGLF